MNFTRWSARLPGTRRAAARDDRSSVPAARAEYARPEPGAGSADGDTLKASPGASADISQETTGRPADQTSGPALLEDLSAREILGRLPALVALVHGPDHRIAYVNDAYAAAFGPRPTGATAAEAMPELDELSLLPLMDQVLRSGTPARSSPARSAAATRTP